MTPTVDPSRDTLTSIGDRLALCGLVLLYVVGFLLLVSLRPPSANSDATAYLNLAQHYVDGDLRDAVVSHWSPMFTWLLVPLSAKLV